MERDDQSSVGLADQEVEEENEERADAAATATDDDEELTAEERARRRRLAERMLEGRRAGARNGRHQSGTTPYGYVRDYAAEGPGVPLVPDEDEAETVRQIFRLYLKKKSMQKVCDELNERGIPSPRGGTWSRATVAWILKNDTYVGKVHFGDIEAMGEHEAIVTQIIFNRVQHQIRQNRRG